MSSSTLISDYMSSGTGPPSGAPPVASGVSAHYYDKSGKKLYVYNWATPGWDAVGGGGGFSPFTPSTIVAPAAASFTLNHSASATATLTNLVSGRGVTAALTTSASNQSCTFGVAGPSSSAMTVTALVQKNWYPVGNTNVIGAYLKDSTGKAVFFGYIQTSPTAIEWFINSFNSSLALGSNIVVGGSINDYGTVPFWLRVQIAGGNMVSSVSSDGENFQTLDTRTIASLSAVYNGTLSETGVWFFTGVTTSQINLNCYSFSATTP